MISEKKFHKLLWTTVGFFYLMFMAMAGDMVGIGFFVVFGDQLSTIVDYLIKTAIDKTSFIFAVS